MVFLTKNIAKQENIFMMYGPKTKNEEIDLEEIQILEAYQEAEQYLETGFDDFDLSIFEVGEDQ